MTKTQQAYIDKISAYAIKYAKKYGFPFPSICIAQAIHESGWGKSKLAKEANNHIGIKNNHGGLCKESYIMDAVEEENGKDVVKPKDKWCKYPSIETGIEGYYIYLTVWTHYAPVFGMTDWREATQFIGSHYATRTGYGDKIIKIIEDYNLTQYDSEAETTQYYIVKHGDSLSSISVKFYGTGKRYPDIYEANKKLMDEANKKHGHSKYTIYSGQKLIIPR